jgi:formate/nitrite transporter FocA (FNT family)
MAPTPEEIYARTKEEGKRRLERPFLEEMTTALAAGFDIVAGLAVYALLQAHLQHLLGRDAAHVVASVGFGVSFVFLVTGRGELFTENFLVPLAGVDEDEPHTRRKLLKLWLTSAPCNILAGLVIVLLLTVHSVLPYGTGSALIHQAQVIHANGALALFVSAIFAGALITAMTWFVEGQESMIVRVVIAWITGSIILLGSFDHVIVDTIELIFGYRYGAHFNWAFIAGNFGLAAAGNMLGGIGLITLNRFTQGRSGGRSGGSEASA